MLKSIVAGSLLILLVFGSRHSHTETNAAIDHRLDAALKSSPSGTIRVLVQVNAPSGITAASRGKQVSAVMAVAADYADGAPKPFAVLPYVAMQVDATRLAELQRDSRVSGIYEDRPHEPALLDSTGIIGANLAWSSGYSGTGQAIAVLDTGFDTGHATLQGKTVAEACFSSTDNTTHSVSLCPNGQSQQVGSGAAINCSPSSGGTMGSSCTHGTHVASIALGNSTVVSGVAPGANMVAIQVFSKLTSGCGSSSPCLVAWDFDILQGLEQVYLWRNTYPIASIVLSLSGETYASQVNCDVALPMYVEIIRYLREAGIATVVAAGNDYAINRIGYPACITGAISVGATTKTDTVDAYSNSADFLTLLAPGGNIYAAVPGSFGAKSGTSAATPHVAGALAVLKSKLPTAGVDQLTNVLINTGTPIADTRPGAGNRVKPRINVKAALDALVAVEPTPLPATASDAYEPDNTPILAHMLTVGTPQTHGFGFKGDEDWQRFQVVAGHSYQIETTHLISPTDTYLEVYADGAFKQPIDYNDDLQDSIVLRSIVTVTAASTGVLYSRIYNYDPNIYSGTRYDVLVTDLTLQPPTVTPTPTPTSTPTFTVRSKANLPLVLKNAPPP